MRALFLIFPLLLIVLLLHFFNWVNVFGVMIFLFYGTIAVIGLFPKTQEEEEGK